MIVKTEKERVILREGGKRLAAILERAAAQCVPGAVLSEINDTTAAYMKEFGVRPSFLGYGKPPFPGVVCASVNDGVVHGIPGEYVLQDGDIVTLDAGVWHEGLCTDSAITVGVGNVSEEDTRLMRTAKEARDAQIMAAVAGNTVGDISAASQKVTEKAGYTYPRELGGHGVGRAVHEEPFVASYGVSGTGERLVEGQVLALEPILIAGSGRVRLANDGWLYETVDGARAAQYEHTVIVGNDEAEVVTQP